MQKELFLVRHAEAEHSNFDIKDVERSLTVDGEIMASKVGKFLNKLINTPDLVISSNAERARRTTDLIAEQLQYNPVQIDLSDDLYEASTRILLREINALNDQQKKVIIVGHNPSISFLSEYVTGALIGNIQPAGVVHMKFGDSWQEVSEKNVDLVQYYEPSMF